jgi:hypothetical protein
MRNKSAITLFLAALAAVGTSSSQASFGGPDGFGYTFRDSAELDGPVYDFEDISTTGTALTLTDDDMSAAIDIGFSFNYYGIDYSEVYVSSNGFLTVLAGQLPDFEGQTLPTMGDPDGVIAGWWGDLNPEAGGSIHSQTLGVAPDRRFIVQFTAVPFLGSSASTTHQYKLFEGSNVIEVHYEVADDVDNPTAGIENETGSDGLTYAEDIQLDTPIAVQYLPPETDLVCAGASPGIDRLWPPNHKFVPIEIVGVEDPGGAQVLITIDSIFQDEPVDTVGDGNTEPDAWGTGSSVAHVRAERSGTKKVPGDGRVYHIGFTATGGQGECSGEVIVGVPHDQGNGSIIIDGGPLYDSTL